MKTCRICRGTNLHLFLSLGDQPHCNNLLSKEELGKEPFYPLDMYYCEDCSLVQLGYVVSPEVMFRNYSYVSGTTATLTRHFQQLANIIVDKLAVPPDSLVVDIGSNDGTFLRGFKQRKLRTLGVDPARNIAQVANEAGIETIPEFFGSQVASQIIREKGNARLITAAGVFYHIPDLDDVVAGVRLLLEDNGVFVVQANYLTDMLDTNSFDNIYHEHLCYYSLKPLIVLFKKFDMEIFDVEHNSIHGGSIVVYVRKGITSSPKKAVDQLLAEEKKRGLYSLTAYHDFALRTRQSKEMLVSLASPPDGTASIIW